MNRRSTPEEQGISSAAIARLVRKLDEHQIPMHSLLIARHGYLVAEIYYAPFQKDTLHRMYSETKSFISLAIGLLVTDEKVRLQDAICDYFPEYLPGAVHPWLAEMTIEDMLKMQTCYDKTVYQKDSSTQNWTRSFFQAKPTHRPGTVFQYDTSATQTLCSLVEKLTGKDPLSFLKDRCLREIGFSEESYLMKRPDGSAMGGSGLMAKPADMMRVALMLLNHGRHPEDCGRQVYPEEYLKKALTFQTATIQNSYEEDGYGYQFWILPDGGFRMLGMGSQDTFCFPQQDVAIVCTADTQAIPNGGDMIYHDIKTELLETLSDAPLPENPQAADSLAGLVSGLTLPILSNGAGENAQGYVNGVDYGICQNPAGFLRMKLEFASREKGFLEYENERGVHRLPFGIGCLAESTFPEYNWRCVTSAAWCEKNTFYIRSWVIDEGVSSVHFKLAFLPDGGLTVLMKKTEEVVMNEFQGILNGVPMKKSCQ